MPNYTTPSQKIITEVLTLPRLQQINVIQQLIFAVIKQDKKILIPMLVEAGVSKTEIAKALGIAKSRVSNDY